MSSSSQDLKPVETKKEEPVDNNNSPKVTTAELNRAGSEKKFFGTRRTSNFNESFGMHLCSPRYVSGRESALSYNSCSESFSDFDSWGSTHPCSSAQADAMDAARASYFSRQDDHQPDTGYASATPAVLTSQQFVLSGNKTVKEEAVKEEKEIAVVNLRVEGVVRMPEEKSKKNKKKEKKDKEVPASVLEVRAEVEKLRANGWFDEVNYGHRLEEMTIIGIAAIVEEFNRNPEKYFKTSWLSKRMPSLFGKSHKSPADVVKALREVLIIVDKGSFTHANGQIDKKYEKALEEVSKNVAMIKAFIYGPDSSEPSSDHVVQVAQLAQEVYNANILPMLVKMLPRFEFECKKDVGHIFNNLLRRQIGTRSPTVEYLGARPEILIQLVQGYSHPDIALTSGLMLRESIRHDHLAKIILYSDVFYTFFQYVQSEVFDIASDAFSTFKDLTTKHKAISAEFLDSNYDAFFAEYECLLNSKNYVTRRQSLKLLGEVLLDRHNFNTMTKYISNPDNLKLMMELLRDKSRNIQYEAFHVFKVFVANPNKPKPISDILNRNAAKLVEFLTEFHNDRTDDEQFNDEKAYLIKQIQEMKGREVPKKSKKEHAETTETIPEEPSTSETVQEEPSTSQQDQPSTSQKN